MLNLQIWNAASQTKTIKKMTVEKKQVFRISEARILTTLVGIWIKIIIPEYDDKMQTEAFMDWLLCVENVFAHKPITNGHKVTLGGYLIS